MSNKKITNMNVTMKLFEISFTLPETEEPEEDTSSQSSQQESWITIDEWPDRDMSNDDSSSSSLETGEILSDRTTTPEGDKSDTLSIDTEVAQRATSTSSDPLSSTQRSTATSRARRQPSCATSTGLAPKPPKRRRSSHEEGGTAATAHHYCFQAARKHESRDARMLRACKKVREYLKKTPFPITDSEEEDVSAAASAGEGVPEDDGAQEAHSELGSWTTDGISMYGRSIKLEERSSSATPPRRVKPWDAKSVKTEFTELPEPVPSHLAHRSASSSSSTVSPSR